MNEIQTAWDMFRLSREKYDEAVKKSNRLNTQLQRQIDKDDHSADVATMEYTYRLACREVDVQYPLLVRHREAYQAAWDKFILAWEAEQDGGH